MRGGRGNSLAVDVARTSTIASYVSTVWVALAINDGSTYWNSCTVGRYRCRATGNCIWIGGVRYLSLDNRSSGLRNSNRGNSFGGSFNDLLLLFYLLLFLNDWFFSSNFGALNWRAFDDGSWGLFFNFCRFFFQSDHCAFNRDRGFLKDLLLLDHLADLEDRGSFLEGGHLRGDLLRCTKDRIFTKVTISHVLDTSVNVFEDFLVLERCFWVEIIISNISIHLFFHRGRLLLKV